MSVIRAAKHVPVTGPQVPVAGRKSSRVCGMVPPFGREKIILRPGHTEIAGARVPGEAAAGAALAERSGTGLVYPRTRPALQTGLRKAWLALLGAVSSGNVSIGTTAVGVGVASDGVGVGPPGVGVGVGVEAAAVTIGMSPFESS